MLSTPDPKSAPDYMKKETALLSKLSNDWKEILAAETKRTIGI